MRTWSDEYQRYFYFDQADNRSVWEEPPLYDIVIDYYTQAPISRTPLVASSPVVDTTSSSSAFGVSAFLSAASPATTAATTAAPTVVAAVTREAEPVDPVKQREIEEADRKLAERLQAELDREYELTVKNSPSPAEALARLKQTKRPAANKTPATSPGGAASLVSNGAIIKDALAEQGFVVKVAKAKNNKPPSKQ